MKKEKCKQPNQNGGNQNEKHNERKRPTKAISAFHFWRFLWIIFWQNLMEPLKTISGLIHLWFILFYSIAYQWKCFFKKKNKRKWNNFFLKKKIEQKRTKWGDSSIYASIYRRGGPRVKKNQSSKRVRDEEKSSARLFREQRLLSFRVELGEEEDCGCSETTVLCLWLDVYNLDFGCYFKERDTCSGRPAEMASNEWNDPQASKRGLVFRERDMRQIDRCVRITYIYIISVV